MSILDLWRADKSQLFNKTISQVIAFCGDGQLTDNSSTSKELRDYLRHIPSASIAKYVEECLKEHFTNSGLALQDLVNEIGTRLGFVVIPGRYRGTVNQTGQDGIWGYPDGHCLVVEVKTTDTYRIDLATIARYRDQLVTDGKIRESKSSMLIIVGRQDTGDLEAQIRGSRYAWDMRLISVDALLRLLSIKEEVEDPKVLARIHDVLIPREFTRLDLIIDIAFSAVQEAKEEQVDEDREDEQEEGEKKFVPVSFWQQYIDRIEDNLNVTFLKRSKASFFTADEEVRLVCSISKYHEKFKSYWFAFHPHQAEYLGEAKRAYVAFGCGSAENLFLIPFSEFYKWIDKFNTTQLEDRHYWHVKIRKEDTSYSLVGKGGKIAVDLSKYLMR